MKVHEDKLEVEYDTDYSTSFFTQGGLVRSIFAFSDTTFLAYIVKKVLLVDNFTVTKKMSVDLPQLYSHMPLPGFNLDEFPFIIRIAKETYDLFNIKTGVTSKLI